MGGFGSNWGCAWRVEMSEVDIYGLGTAEVNGGANGVDRAPG